jgi:flagellar biosynthesis/type III secretory pathway chaperone
MQVIDAFRQVMEQELAIIEQLIETGQTKRKVISDPAQLSSVVDQERALLTSLEQTERERCQLFDVMAPGQDLHTWLATTAETDLAHQVHGLRAKYQDLQQINQLNQQLIQESLNLVQYCLNIFVAEPPMIYTNPKTQAASKSIIDRKV